MKKFLVTASFVVVIIFAVILQITRTSQLDKDLMDTARTIASFIFGALFAYYLGNSNDKHKLIVNNLRKDDALIISLYQQFKYFDKETKEELIKLLDNYLQSEIDYYLSEYYMSSKEFMKLYVYIQGIKTNTEEEKKAKDFMFSVINNSLELRKSTEANALNRMSAGEWITLFVFALIILLTTIVLYNGSIESIVVSLLLSFGVIILLLLLEKIDNLKWRQDEFIWLPLTLLFRELSLLPYFPNGIIKNRKFRKIKGSIRIATYPNKYPDISGKTIEVKEIK